jgi:DNA invertase Pin-like site-specific DNA recombinase
MSRSKDMERPAELAAKQQGARLGIEWFSALAASKGGRCLSVEYENYYGKLRFACREGHAWEASGKTIREGGWCPECAKAARERASDERAAALVKLFKEGVPRPELERMFEVSPRTSVSILRQAGLLRPYKLFSESDEAQVRELYAAGSTRAALASKFGVSLSTVHKALSGSKR